jgi:hypothetical protein
MAFAGDVYSNHRRTTQLAQEAAMANIPHLKTNGLKLKLEFKAAWLEALWSECYNQGQNYMRMRVAVKDPDNGIIYGDRYCCVGVAADVSVRMGNCPIQWSNKTDVGVHSGSYIFGSSAELLRSDEAKQLGWFDEQEGLSDIRSVLGQLAEINDSGDYTFTEIGMAIALYL